MGTSLPTRGRAVRYRFASPGPFSVVPLLAVALFAVALFAGALSAAPRAEAGWWDDLDKGDQVKLSDLVAEPDRWKGKVVTFACIHHEPADIYSPYFTSFAPDKYFNFTAWLDGSPLWELDAFQRDDFPYLYLRREHPQRDELFRVDPYTRIEYTGRVRDVYRQRPWIEILAFRRTPATLGKRVLDWVKAGDAYLSKSPADLVAAESHYKLALAEISLDETYKLRIRKRLADVLRAAGKDDAARGVDGGVPILGGTPTPGVGDVPSLPDARRPAAGTSAPPPSALTSDLPGVPYDSRATPPPGGSGPGPGTARGPSTAPVTVPGTGFRAAAPPATGAPPPALTEDIPGTAFDAPKAPTSAPAPDRAIPPAPTLPAPAPPTVPTVPSAGDTRFAPPGSSPEVPPAPVLPPPRFVPAPTPGPAPAAAPAPIPAPTAAPAAAPPTAPPSPPPPAAAPPPAPPSSSASAATPTVPPPPPARSPRLTGVK